MASLPQSDDKGGLAMTAPLEIEATLKAGPGLRFKDFLWADAPGSPLGVTLKVTYRGCG